MSGGWPLNFSHEGTIGGLLAVLAVATAVAAHIALSHAGMGPLTHHMSLHIVLMNLVAPAAALAILTFAPVGKSRMPGWVLASVTVAQVAALSLWHLPVALNAALQHVSFHFFMQVSLLVSALLFWFAVFADRGAFRWRAIFALLVTGKIFCLIGILFIFAPRPLYQAIASSHHDLPQPVTDQLADQHLAGLLMIVACPATYVLAGVVIAARWIGELMENDSASKRSCGMRSVRLG